MDSILTSVIQSRVTVLMGVPSGRYYTTPRTYAVGYAKPKSLVPGKKTQIYSNIQDAAVIITEGIVLACDPSIGSQSSMPGWAVYDAGEYVDAGVLNIDPTGTKWERLKEVYRQFRNLSRRFMVDACVYEEVPVSAHGGRSQVSHASLLYAVGVTMAAVDARKFIGIPPVTWKRFVSEYYVKSDMQDAIEMGQIVIDMATEIRKLEGI
jgi:hypothetical protein